jgi:hypothetical protein
VSTHGTEKFGYEINRFHHVSNVNPIKPEWGSPILHPFLKAERFSMISGKKHFRKPTIFSICGERLTGRRIETKRLFRTSDAAGTGCHSSQAGADGK